MTDKTLTMMAVGDLILDEPQAETYFDHVTSVLKSSDVVVGQVEVAFTDGGFCASTDVVAPPCNPINMSAIPNAGFNVATLAGNHIWDSGPAGIQDTIAGLQNYGIAVTGAGMNIDEARRPAIITRNGTTFGFLSYNCVGPRESWATAKKPGCAYVNIFTHYELDHATPGGPPSIYTFAEPKSLELMMDDIRKLRPNCNILVVSLHKGIGHVPSKLAMYEKEVSHAAIDAGADLILGHHAHILKGIEQYQGKIIFHGLGNFVTVTRVLTPNPSQDSQQWAKRRKELFGFEPDPEYPTYPFHPEAKQTIIAKCTINNSRITRVGYLPCFINKKGQPKILHRNDEQGQQVFTYMDKITRNAGLNARYEWDDNEVIIH